MSCIRKGLCKSNKKVHGPAVRKNASKTRVLHGTGGGVDLWHGGQEIRDSQKVWERPAN